MWGDRFRAASMEQGTDHLATLLFQISSPAHIPWADQRWQEVLHGYDVWVHMDDSNPLIKQACMSMTKNAELSSNLAAFALHVTRMLRGLVHDVRTLQSKSGFTSQSRDSDVNNENDAAVTDFSTRIASVAKARATAGVLQLLRLFCHSVIVEASKDAETSMNTIKEVFNYRTRGDLAADQSSGFPLIHSLLDLITILGTKRRILASGSTIMNSTTDFLRIPEMYDTAIFSFKLFFVLCGTQLYQPFYSSFESSKICHFFLDEVFRQPNDDQTVNNDKKANDGHNLQTSWSSGRSEGSYSTCSNGNTSSHRSQRKSRQKRKRNEAYRGKMWTPKLILETCFNWNLDRPPAPKHSISHYYYMLAQSAVESKVGEKPGQDGLYENFMVVQASSPSRNNNGTIAEKLNHVARNKSDDSERRVLAESRTHTKQKSSIVDTTKGILSLSESIIFLPFRLLNLVYGVFSATNKHGSCDLDRAVAMKKLCSSRYSRTRDVLWLSESLLADLSCSMILIFASNNRNDEKSNAFRMELRKLSDNRWDHGNGGQILPDLVDLKSSKELDASSQLYMPVVNEKIAPLSTNQEFPIMPATTSSYESHLTLNFESLFVSFGRTLHNELGALLLYTMIHSSPSFAESLSVRSDMDSIVVPLLRTLYFAFRNHTYMAKDFKGKSRSNMNRKGAVSTTTTDIRDCPFRCISQLYVIIILLLLFSQDSSFGRDVFRRVTISAVPWYKERSLKGINLGSLMILTLLRSLIFNLNRLNDIFLLNNCCAVLENLSPSTVDLHEYAAMRLVSVTVLVMRKHVKMVFAAAKDGNTKVLLKKKKATEQHRQGIEDKKNHSNNDNQSDTLNMYSEVTRTLLGIIKHGVSPRNIESNAYLIHALVYHQVDLLMLGESKYNLEKMESNTTKNKLYSSKQMATITSVIVKASEVIQDEGARSAAKVLEVIESHMKDLKAVSIKADYEMANRSLSKRNRKKKHQSNSDDVALEDGINDCIGDIDGNVTGSRISAQSASTAIEDEFTFLYEEEADPEVFFVPYVWDLIVSVITAGTMEWEKDDIKVFPLLEAGDNPRSDDFDVPAGTGTFSLNGDEMV